MTAEEAVTYLLREKLIQLDQVVRYGLVVRDVTRRNTNFQVAHRNGTGLFLKRQSPGDSSSALRAEGGIYQRVSGDERLARLRPLIPGFHRYDADLRLLVLDLCQGTSVAAIARRGRVPRIGPDLGGFLAVCHGATRLGEGDERGDGLFHAMPPALELGTPGPSFFREASPLQLDLTKQIQARARVQARLEQLPGIWNPECLIHGDIRWDNVLVEESPDAGVQPSIKVVDWESAGIGDPAWDAGCVLFAYLAACLDCSIESTEAETIGHEFSTHLGESQVDVQAFWDSYTRAVALDGQSAARFLDRAMSFCGARLIQHAFELTRGVSAMPAVVVFTLQLAINMLSDEGDVPGVLFGIETAGSPQ